MIWMNQDMSIWALGAILFVVYLLSLLWMSSHISRSVLLRRAAWMLIALIALILLILRPAIEQEKQIERSTATISANGAELNDQRFVNVHQLINDPVSQQIDRVHITDINIKSADAKLLNTYPIELHIDSLPQGIFEVNVPYISADDSWTIYGKTTDKVSTIILSGPTEYSEQSVVSDQQYAVNGPSLPAGRYLIDISAIVDQDTITEQLPINVYPKSKWNLLQLSAYPNYESNYLKNHWIADGNGFAQRSEITTGKYQYSYSNIAEASLDHINRKAIDPYNFLLIDIPVWNHLNASERRTILNAVSDQGKGLIIRPTAANQEAEGIQNSRISKLSSTLLTDTPKDIKLNQYNLLSSSSWRTIKTNKVTTAYERRYGLGHIAIIAIDQSYPLLLEDQADLYQSLWAQIFSSVYAAYDERSAIISPEWIWAEENNKLLVISESTDWSPRIDSTEMYWSNSPLIDGAATIEVNPKSGYNTLTINDQESIEYYVHPADSWAALRAYQNGQALRLLSRNETSESSTHLSTYYTEISPLWWISLLIISLAALWYDERIS